MLKFKLFKTTVFLSYPFCFAVTVLAVLDKTGFLFASLMCVILHETGHLAIMHFIKIRCVSATLKIGTISIITKEGISIKKRALIAVGGPLMNFMCVPLLSFGGFFEKLGAASLAMCLFNLLPSAGLDGGDIAYFLFCRITEKYAETMLKVSSLLCVVLIIILGAYLLCITGGNSTMLLAGIYLIFFSFIKV